MASHKIGGAFEICPSIDVITNDFHHCYGLIRGESTEELLH